MIFCEDLRVEMSGREIALGLFNGTAAVPQIPFILPMLVARLELHFFGKPREKFFFRVNDPSGNRLFEQVVQVQFADWNKPGSLAIGIRNMVLPVTGAYAFYLKFEDEWDLARNLYVEKFDASDLRERLELQLGALAKSIPDQEFGA
jgi:hypothetical protein